MYSGLLMDLAYGQGGLKLEINIPLQHILAKSKGGLIIEGSVSSSEYGMSIQQNQNLAPYAGNLCRKYRVKLCTKQL